MIEKMLNPCEVGVAFRRDSKFPALTTNGESREVITKIFPLFALPRRLKR